MNTHTLLLVIGLSAGLLACTSKNEEKKVSAPEQKSTSGDRKMISPEALRDKVITLKPPAAKATSLDRLPFDLSAPRPGMEVEGAVTDGLRWRDTLGENVVLFSRKPTGVQRPTKDTLGDEGPGRALYATHYLSPKTGGPPVRKRVVRDRYESCGFDLAVRFLKASFVITDLDADGVGEASFAYVVDCTSDVSPLTIKLLMLEDGAKYILRGESRVQVGEDKWTGGVFKVDQSFTLAPTNFLIHAGNLWMKINTLQ